MLKLKQSAIERIAYLNEHVQEKKKKEEQGDDIAPVAKKSSPGSSLVLKESVADVMQNNDIAPVPDERKWFEKGAFEDGYQRGDVIKTILGSNNDVLQNMGQGVRKFGENVVDFGADLVGQVADKVGADKFANKMKDFVAKDLSKELSGTVATSSQIANTVVDVFGANMPMSNVYRWLPAIHSIVNGKKDNSVFGDKSDSLVQSATQFAIQSGLNMSGVPWYLTAGVTSYGGEVENAYGEGATHNEAALSGLISAGGEILTEKLFGGSGLDEKGLINLEPLTKGIVNKALKALADYGIDLFSEGAEEVVSQFVGNLGSALYKEEKLGELLFSEEAIDGYIESFIGGMFISGGANVGKVASSIKSGRDYRTGLSTNEQKVVEKIIENRIAEKEKDGKKLTKKERAVIEEAVVRDMERGYISTDTIEEVLGGETYKTHKDTIDSEKAMQEEYDTLYRMKNGDKSDAQIDRQAELKQKLEDIKQNFNRNQLQDEVMSLVRNDRLAESYNERSRRGQAFEADISKYDEKQRVTIQKAIDSGILNNTNRTHEFVDMIAKITADKGVPFDFTNNERLKESGFALNGKTVNGYVTKDGVTLNIDSAKSLNSVVGHEITHVLEGTEMYPALQSVVAEYAKTKGEYQSRYDALAKLYKDIYGADIDAELTADLVGDYLFTDPDFVKHLSVTNKKAFQKIFDEIKYLCRVATAGSKELRELEKVKKLFEEAYRAEIKNTADNSDVKYSITEPFTDANGNQFENAVLLDTDFFDGVSPRNWGQKLRDAVGKRAVNNPFILPIVDESGNTVMLQFANPKDRVTKNGASNHKVLDELSTTSDNISKLAVIHVDEIVSVSEENSPYYTNENKHQWLDQNGWLHRNTNVINQRNGNIYNLTVDIAKTADGRTILYATNGKIKRVGNVKVDSLKIKGPWQNSNSGDRVAQNDLTVKMDYSLSDSNVEDIAPIGNYNVYGKDIALETAPVEEVAPVREDVAGNATDEENLFPDDIGSALDGYENRVEQVFESLKDLKRNRLKTVDGYSVGVYTRNGSDDVTLSIKKPNGEIIRDVVEGGKYWTNSQLQHEIASRIADAEGYVPKVTEEATATDDIAPVAEKDTPVKTTKERLATKLSNRQSELSNIEKLRADSNKAYDEKIAKAQADLDSKKDKDSKVANILKKRIERLKRLKADIDAGYAKRINDINKSIDKTSAELEKDHTEKDRYAKAVNRINTLLEHDKAEAKAEYAKRRADVESRIADKTSYTSQMAKELYDELRGLKKGVRASDNLASLLDAGYDWGNIRSALTNVRYNPSGTVNPSSDTEAAVRQLINESYEEDVYSIDDLDVELAEELNKLDTQAEEDRKKARTATQRRVKSEEYTNLFESLVGDTTHWKDKKLGISYKINTLRRNLRDVVRKADGSRDIGKADAIYDELQGKYNHNEAILNREASQIKQPYADMKITKAEDAYIQMLGELRHNPDTTLTEDVVHEFYEKHKGNIDKAKVDKAIEMARKTYDELLIRVNEVLREQGMKEIPYRKGYFPHFTEDKQSFLAKLFNWKAHNNDIPTDIAGLTENFNPNRSWQSFNKERKSDTTDYSFMKGMDTYAQGALDWVHHIEDIQKRRAFENYLRYIHSEQGVKDKIEAIKKNEEYDADEMQKQIDLVYEEARNPLNNFVVDLRAGTNTLANKKSSMDRGLEDATNRKFYSTMTNISSRVSANMVGGSISSALTNFIPITQSWGQVSPVSSLRAMGDTIRSTFRDDGTINKSDFLTNRLRPADNLYKSGWDKVSNTVGLLMEGIDSFTSQTVWRSKYLENISNGMSESEAIKNADQFAENVLAGRSRGNQPTIFDSKNPLVKTLTAFQLEVANQYGYMLKDMPQDMRNETKAKLVKGYATMFLGAYAYNALFSSLTGRDSAFDPIGIIEDLLRDLGLFGDDEEEEEIAPVDVVMNLTENILQEVPFVGGLMGGGRVPISSALPYDGNVMDTIEGASKLVENTINLITGKGDPSDMDFSDLTSEWLKPVYYVVSPVGGGQIKKTVEGLSMFSNDHPIAGSYTKSGDLRFPVDDTLGSRVKAGLFGQYASKNAREYFDNGYAPLKEKQIQEFADVDIPIRDYWEYREGLSGLSKLSEKADYIADLDLPIAKKNLLINNIADREEDIDLTGYDDFSDFEEFDFAVHNPEKYKIAQTVGGYDAYVKYQDGMKDMKLPEKVDYVAGLDLTDAQKNALINGETDRKEPIDLTGYNTSDYSSFEEFEFSKENPGRYGVAKAVGGYEDYTGFMDAIGEFDSKNANGETVSGLKKERVTAYINGLDLDYGQKIILYRSQYDGKADRAAYDSDIFEYLNGRGDISYEEKVAIFKKLGFSVSADGYVTW